MDNIDYVASRRKDYRSGLFLMPMSVGSPEVVRLHDPYEVIATPFEVVGRNAMPTIPSPDIKDETLLSGVVDVSVPTNHAAYATYAVRGEYLHVTGKSPTGLMDLDVGLNPKDKGMFPGAKLKPQFFVTMVGSQQGSSIEQGQ